MMAVKMRANIKLCFGTELQKGLGTFLEPTGSIVFQVDTHNGIKSFSFLLLICFYFHEILLSILYCLNRNAFVVQGQCSDIWDRHVVGSILGTTNLWILLHKPHCGHVRLSSRSFIALGKTYVKAENCVVFRSFFWRNYGSTILFQD